MASKNNAKNCAQMRPRNPTYLKRTSLLIPPKDLANRFIKPKAPAKAEASAAGSWKYVLKCVASWLFMASSVPKQAEYWKIITTTRTSFSTST
eukprot:Skav201781  [mRNA]  locus=scaffold2375:51506:52010:+ [translate_table: standard]